jgi:hypothetical protein
MLIKICSGIIVDSSFELALSGLSLEEKIAIFIYVLLEISETKYRKLGV